MEFQTETPILVKDFLIFSVIETQILQTVSIFR